MMPLLKIGNTEITYVIRHSAKARRRQITVTPDKVEVLLPEGMDTGSAHAFIREKRRWVYDKREEMLEQRLGMAHPAPEPLVSGAKILFRGRRMRLRVKTTGEPDIRVEYKNGFVIHRPATSSDADVRRALDQWLQRRVRVDIDGFVRHYAHQLKAAPTAVRVGDFKKIWGSCGKGGTISLNWRLVAAPKPVLEYAVIHELCHLRQRNHSPAFWSLVARLAPDYEIRKRWLDVHQCLLDARHQ